MLHSFGSLRTCFLSFVHILTERECFRRTSRRRCSSNDCVKNIIYLTHYVLKTRGVRDRLLIWNPTRNVGPSSAWGSVSKPTESTSKSFLGFWFGSFARGYYASGRLLSFGTIHAIILFFAVSKLFGYGCLWPLKSSIRLTRGE